MEDWLDINDIGLTPDEQRQLARELLCEGKYPRVIRIERTGTTYTVNKWEGRRLLRRLGIEQAMSNEE